MCRKSPRKGAFVFVVDSPGIGPGTRHCERRVMPLYYEPLVFCCGPKETRTPYLLIANEALYQMSYGPFLITLEYNP